VTEVPARAWRTALFVLMALGIAFAVRPLTPHASPETWFLYADKVHHLWFFGLLWWLGLRAGFRAGWGLALGLLVYGLSIELAQFLTPVRRFEASDLVADGVGIALAWSLTRWRLARQPQEHRG
jgi:hypothetical protein